MAISNTDNIGVPDWLSKPIIVDSDDSVPLNNADFFDDLSKNTIKRAQDAGISEWFAVQKSVIPLLLKNPELYPHSRRFKPGDICVSAPTGSGKTLTYVIPVVEILHSRTIVRLRALIILPTRDLVIQVKDAFEHFVRGTSLKIGIATGQNSFSNEQNMLVGKIDNENEILGGQSKVDILIATPGRLVDHLDKTSGFTLQHLRFLIIDEVDRLMNQNFQDWLIKVLSEIDKFQYLKNKEISKGNITSPRFSITNYDPTYELPPSPTQKLLFSATLTRNPGKIVSLNLYKPKYVAIQHKSKQDNNLNDIEIRTKFEIPSTLHENMVIVMTEEKPLALFHLIYHENQRGILCFTKSVEHAHRLCILLNEFQNAYNNTSISIIAAEYSSDLSHSERNKLLGKFNTGEIHILVCSDLISRGIDLPSVRYIINYDIPGHMKKYIHRIGRTARAGKEGDAWSLVEKHEARYFKEMLSKSNHLSNIKQVKFNDSDFQDFLPAYQKALEALKAKMIGSY